jgi:hypothetical protein
MARPTWAVLSHRATEKLLGASAKANPQDKGSGKRKKKGRQRSKARKRTKKRRTKAREIEGSVFILILIRDIGLRSAINRPM